MRFMKSWIHCYLCVYQFLKLNLDSFSIPSCYKDDLSAVIIPSGMIEDRVKALAYEIHRVVQDQPLTLLCILKGSYRFFTTLVDELTEVRRHCHSLLTIDFVRLQSYSDTQSTGTVNILGLSSIDELKEQNVLIVEDVVDSGNTLAHLLDTLNVIGVKKAWTAVLMSKRVKREREVKEDFVAFDVADKFIVGYGLDYNQKFRDLRHVCVISPKGIEKYKIAEDEKAAK
ncbi:unnamed protein product [Enterobius vermicularis]|uniref:Hypoxanthine phosphoribosyltransferase n=1 Tax=Enterobius vermicularis TaxID=51028 RepID=A0A0N4UZI4_ENTVE|nr:unnamed protein product [Enterobius vermicularis]